MKYGRCTATTKAGEPCEAFVASPDGLCASHDPRSNLMRRRHSIGTLQRRRTNLIGRIAKLQALQAQLDEVEATIAFLSRVDGLGNVRDEEPA